MHRRARPDVVAEADESAVEGVAVIVLRQRIGLAVEGEGTPGDAVGVAADGFSEVRAGRAGRCRAVLGDIVLQRLEAKHDVRALTRAVRDVDGLHDAAEGQDSDLHVAGVSERVAVYGSRLARVRLDCVSEEFPAHGELARGG